MASWTDDVADSLVKNQVVLMVGPSGSGKTYAWEYELPRMGWTPNTREADDPLPMAAWLARATGSTFQFTNGKPVAVVDAIDTLSIAERAALLACVKHIVKSPTGQTRPLLLIGQSCGRDLARLLANATVHATRWPNAETAADALASRFANLPRARLLACCARAQEDDGVDANRACALAYAEVAAADMGAIVSSGTDSAAGCPDAAHLLGSADSLAPGVLERRVDGDAATAFSLLFENTEALVDRVYAAGRAKARVRSALLDVCAGIEPFVSSMAGRQFVGAMLCAGMRSVLGDLPRRVRKADGAAPFARAALWSRGATAAQAFLRRADAAATACESAAVMRAREKN